MRANCKRIAYHLFFSFFHLPWPPRLLPWPHFLSYFHKMRSWALDEHKKPLINRHLWQRTRKNENKCCFSLNFNSFLIAIWRAYLLWPPKLSVLLRDVDETLSMNLIQWIPVQKIKFWHFSISHFCDGQWRFLQNLLKHFDMWRMACLFDRLLRWLELGE